MDRVRVNNDTVVLSSAPLASLDGNGRAAGTRAKPLDWGL